MLKFKTLFLTAAISLTSFASNAVLTADQSLKVTGTYVYAEFGNGDVVIKYAGTVAGCEDGFWLSPAQAGFKQAYAELLTAVAGGRNVYVSGDTALLWAGSSGKYCKVYSIHVEW